MLISCCSGLFSRALGSDFVEPIAEQFANKFE
jgi:hypothetical protein